MTDDHTTLLLERLRLAASLVHALPHVALELAVEHGPHLVVSHDRTFGPDVSPCEFRQMVGRMIDHGPLAVGFGWVREITSIDVGGSGVQHHNGVVSVELPADQRLLTAFATDLGSAAIMASARQVADDLIADDPCAIVALREVQLRVERDDVLDVSTVVLPWPLDDDPGEADVITTAIARRCWVDAFIGAAMSHS